MGAAAFFAGQGGAGDQHSGFAGCCWLHGRGGRLAAEHAACMRAQFRDTCRSVLPARTTPTCCHMIACTLWMNFSVFGGVTISVWRRNFVGSACATLALTPLLAHALRRRAHRTPILPAGNCWPGGWRRERRCRRLRRQRTGRAATSVPSSRCARHPWRNARRDGPEPVGGDVDVVLQAGGVDRGEALAHLFGIQVGQVEIDGRHRAAADLEFMSDGPRHHVARRQFRQLVILAA